MNDADRQTEEQVPHDNYASWTQPCLTRCLFLHRRDPPDLQGSLHASSSGRTWAAVNNMILWLSSAVVLGWIASSGSLLEEGWLAGSDSGVLGSLIIISTIILSNPINTLGRGHAVISPLVFRWDVSLLRALCQQHQQIFAGWCHWLYHPQNCSWTVAIIPEKVWNGKTPKLLSPVMFAYNQSLAIVTNDFNLK